MRRTGWLAGLLLLLLTNGVSAQTPTQEQGTLQQRLRPPAPTSVEAVPRLTTEEKVRLKETQPVDVRPAVRGQSVALMIAGGALFVAGILADGDVGSVLMLSGALVGAYGIYLYFR